MMHKKVSSHGEASLQAHFIKIMRGSRKIERQNLPLSRLDCRTAGDVPVSCENGDPLYG